MELEEFKKFIEERKLSHHDVAFYLGYSPIYIYTIMNGVNKMSGKFVERASKWMEDELQVEANKKEIKRLNIKGRDFSLGTIKIANTSIEASRAATKRWNENHQISLKDQIRLAIKELNELVSKL